MLSNQFSQSKNKIILTLEIFINFKQTSVKNVVSTDASRHICHYVINKLNAFSHSKNRQANLNFATNDTNPSIVQGFIPWNMTVVDFSLYLVHVVRTVSSLWQLSNTTRLLRMH